jgi:hypothetical protein
MKKIFMFAAVVSAMLASCSNEDAPVVSQEQKAKVELGVSAGIADVRGTASTRALVDGFTAEADKVALFVTGGSDVSNYYVPKVGIYTWGSTTWTALAEDTKIYLSDQEATVYGFYPSDAVTSPATLTNDGANKIGITVSNSTTDFSGSAQLDYMYATGRTGTDPSYNYPLAKASNDVDNNKNKVDLYFHHALSKLSFVVNRDASYNGAGLLTSVKLSKTGQFTSGTGTMLIKDGKIEGLTAADGITFTGTATINTVALPGAVLVKGLVAPTTSLAADIDLTLKIDNKSMTVKLPVNTFNKWEAGNNYTYTVTVKGTELVVSSVAILAWIDNKADAVVAK